MDKTLFEEHIDYLSEISQWFGVLNEGLANVKEPCQSICGTRADKRGYLSELNALLGIDPHNTAKQINVIRLKIDLLSVENDLLELACLGEALNDFHRYVGT